MQTLRALRERAFLTQKDVSDFVGVTVGTVSNWERGSKQPELGNIRKLAELYHTTPQIILDVWNTTKELFAKNQTS